MTNTYTFIDDSWDENRQFHSSLLQNHKNLPIAIETEAAFVFRDAAGNIVHKYPWPGSGDIATLTTYLAYLVREEPERIPANYPKGILVRQIFFLLRQLAKAGRKRINVLEVGATLGENFYFIKNLIRRYNLGLEVYFIGIEVSPGLCNFARMAHHEDPNFQILAGDGSDLSRFPDQSFDVVLCQGVANFTYDPKLTLRELIRVTRFAAVLAVQVTDRSTPYHFTDGEHGWLHFIPTRADLRQAWEPHFPLYDYKFCAIPMQRLNCSGGGNDYYLGQDSAKLDIEMEWHTVSRYPLLSSEKIA